MLSELSSVLPDLAPALDALRGRLMGLYAFVFVGMNPFGALFIGSVAEKWGVPAACMTGGGIGAACLAALTLLWGRRASTPSRAYESPTV